MARAGFRGGRETVRVTRRRELPPNLGDAFAFGAARASGVPARRLDARDLEAPFRGARVKLQPMPDLSHYERREYELRRLCAALVAVAPQDLVFSHITAARLYGMPVPERLIARELHVSTSGQPPRRDGIAGHRSRDARRIVSAGLPLVPPELAWLQLATVLTLDELIVAGDYLVRRKHPLSTLDAMGRELAAPGRRGLAMARTAFGWVRVGTDSPPESWMRLEIVHAGFPEPLVGCAAHHDGYFIGTPDLSYPEYRIAYEYQGAGHRGVSEFESDILRLELFHEAEWKVIQVTKQLLARPGWLAERTRRALLSRGWTPSTQL